MTDVAVILNPRAGHGADEERQREITDLFATLGRQATVFVPGEGQDITGRARAAVQAGCRVLVAAGGDGTVNAVASAVVALGSPIASDNCGDPTISSVRSDGAAMDAPYPVGVTTVIWTATDAAGNKASVTQTVTVLDLEPPVFQIPVECCPLVESIADCLGQRAFR